MQNRMCIPKFLTSEVLAQQFNLNDSVYKIIDLEKSHTPRKSESIPPKENLNRHALNVEN